MTHSVRFISTFKYKLLIWSFDRKIDVNSNNMNFLELNNFFDFYFYLKLKSVNKKRM